MDASALIFVALAVAWAAYLIPKALEHHDESIRSRTVDKFSKSMRVIARREPVGRGRAELVTPRRTPSTPSATGRVVTRGRPPVSPARRRRRVLALVLLAVAVVVGLAVAGVVATAWVAVPFALLVAWLVACRLMVKRERAVRRPARPARPQVSVEPEPEALQEATAVVAEHATPLEPTQPARPAEILAGDLTEEHAAVPAADGTWDPQSVPLPTYVSKPAAPRRSVRTIDLDSTGVWSSGPSESDSKLVRDTDEAARVAKALAEGRRHSG